MGFGSSQQLVLMFKTALQIVGLNKHLLNELIE